MFKSILGMQWKSARSVVLLATLLCFTVPVYSLRMAQAANSTANFLGYMQSWSVIYAGLAAALGLLVALLAWTPDHRGNHVYALTLPLARWRYVLLRFAAGLVVMSPPIVALGVGSLVVAASSGIPQGLHAYPLALTFRFAFAALVGYAIFFSISSATARTAAYILGAIGVIVVAQILASASGWNADIAGRASDVVFSSPGLLAVFGGRWMLIDA